MTRIIPGAHDIHVYLSTVDGFLPGARSIPFRLSTFSAPPSFLVRPDGAERPYGAVDGPPPAAHSTPTTRPGYLRSALARSTKKPAGIGDPCFRWRFRTSFRCAATVSLIETSTGSGRHKPRNSPSAGVARSPGLTQDRDLDAPSDAIPRGLHCKCAFAGYPVYDTNGQPRRTFTVWLGQGVHQRVGNHGA
jgi:hypothetical protein